MRSWLVLTLAACGGVTANTPSATPDPSPARQEVRPGVPPASDEAALRAQLAGEVRNAGLWFADDACRAQFGKPGVVAPDAFDAFARCVAGLHLRPTGRAHWLDDSVVLTDDAGFELEARVVAGKLAYIGFAGRAPGMPDLPTITPEALEALRAGGDPRATVSDAVATSLARDTPNPQLTEHLRVCLDAAGTVTTVVPSTATTVESAKAFTAIARTWNFRPFTADNAPLPVCAIAAFRYPAGAPEPRLPKPPALSKAGNIVYTISPRDLEHERVAGDRVVVPDDGEMTRVRDEKQSRVVGVFQLCLDEGGRHESAAVVKSTGLPRYDAKIVKALTKWRYRPHLADGVPVPVCTAITFIYSLTIR